MSDQKVQQELRQRAEAARLSEASFKAQNDALKLRFTGASAQEIADAEAKADAAKNAWLAAIGAIGHRSSSRVDVSVASVEGPNGSRLYTDETYSVNLTDEEIERCRAAAKAHGTDPDEAIRNYAEIKFRQENA